MGIWTFEELIAMINLINDYGEDGVDLSEEDIYKLIYGEDSGEEE